MYFFIQLQNAYLRHRQDHKPSSVSESASAPSFMRSVTSYRNRHHNQRVASRPRAHQTSRTSLPLACQEQDEAEQQHPDASPWQGHLSGSHFSLPNLGSTTSHSACSSPAPPSKHPPRSCSLRRSPSLMQAFRLNVDTLVGAEETDVDTGDVVKPGSSVDLSVVSAYIKSSLPLTPRPLSAPPEDVRPPLSPCVPVNTYKSATLGRTPNSFSVRSYAVSGSRPQSTSLSTSAAPSSSDVSINLSDSCSIISAPAEETDGPEEEEFYI